MRSVLRGAYYEDEISRANLWRCGLQRLPNRADFVRVRTGNYATQVHRVFETAAFRARATETVAGKFA